MSTAKKAGDAATQAAKTNAKSVAAAVKVASAPPAGSATQATIVAKPAEVAGSAGNEALAMTKDYVETAVKAGPAAFGAYEVLMRFSRDNVDAAIRAGVILAKGVQELNRSALALVQEQAEGGVAATRQLFTARTAQEVVEIQSSIVKDGFGKFVAESGRLVDTSFRIAEEAAAPLTARVSSAAKELAAVRA